MDLFKTSSVIWFPEQGILLMSGVPEDKRVLVSEIFYEDFYNVWNNLVNEGRSPKDRREWQILYLYCFDEIKAEYELAQYILEMHKRYDCGIGVSASSFASKVFRKHYLKSPIQQIKSK